MKALLSRLTIDPYIAAIVGMVALASALPVQGRAMAVAGDASKAVIALMFFLQGARLAPQAALAGARHWRLHTIVLVSTFLLFPALGLTARALAPGLLTAAAVGRAADAVRAALHRAVLDRLHLDRPRQRAGGVVRGDRIQPVRHRSDAAAGRIAAQRPGRVLRPRRGRHRAAASAAVRRRPARPARGSANGSRATSGLLGWSIAARSCWWSMSRSARA